MPPPINTWSSDNYIQISCFALILIHLPRSPLGTNPSKMILDQLSSCACSIENPHAAFVPLNHEKAKGDIFSYSSMKITSQPVSPCRLFWLLPKPPQLLRTQVNSLSGFLKVFLIGCELKWMHSWHWNNVGVWGMTPCAVENPCITFYFSET